MLLPMQHNADGCSYNVIHPFFMMKYAPNIHKISVKWKKTKDKEGHAKTHFSRKAGSEETSSEN